MTRASWLTWFSTLPLALLPVACGDRSPTNTAVAPTRPTSQQQPLPPPSLEPLQAEFSQLAASLPAPDPTHMAQLVDLAATAFAPHVETSLAVRSRRALLDEPDAYLALEQMLEHGDATVRREAASELGRHGKRASWLPLLKQLKYEAHRPTRIELDVALARLGNGSGLADLISRMDEWDVAQPAGRHAIEILRRANRDPGSNPTYVDLQAELRALSDQWELTGALPPDVEPATADDLCRQRVADRISHLQDFDLRTVDESRFILSHCGLVPLPLLRRAVQASEPYLRVHALEILRYLGPVGNAAEPETLPLLADPLTRVQAAQALAELRVEAAAPVLRDWLGSADVELRAVACNALGILGDHRSTPRLEALLADPREPADVRVQAAFALARFAAERPAYSYLQERAGRGDYHPPTVRELLDRVDTWRDPRLREVEGESFAGPWRIRYVGGADRSAVRTAVEAVLSEYERTFDARRPDSEIRACNQHASTTPFTASELLRRVLKDSLLLAAQTLGAWDPTSRPLLDTFADSGASPPKATIATGRERSGHLKVTVDDTSIAKARADLELDFGGVAAAACADRIALAMRRGGARGALVTLAGTSLAFGLRAPGVPWHATSGPARGPGAPPPTGEGSIVLREQAMATFVAGAEHGIGTVDPRTGTRVSEHARSVSVLAPTAFVAAGLARAAMVLGPQATAKVLKDWPGTAPGVRFELDGDAGARVVDLGWPGPSPPRAPEGPGKSSGPR